MSVDRYYIEIDGEFFKRRNDPASHRWVDTKREASRFCEKTADIYIRDWKKYGVKKVKVGKK